MQSNQARITAASTAATAAALAPDRSSHDAFARIAALAARIADTPLALILDVPGYLPRGSYGPVHGPSLEIRQLLNLWKPGPSGAEWIEDLYHDERFIQTLPFLRCLATVPVLDTQGCLCAVIAVADMSPRPHDAARLRQLRDLAALSSVAFDPQPTRRDHARGWRPQDQLLEKSIELAKFGEDLRQLHRLGTTNYESIDHLFADYLATGGTILGMPCGVIVQVRGRYAAMRAVRSDSPSLRPGMTFDLSRVFCGAVVEQRVTIACASARDDQRLSERPHYGPARPGCYVGAPIVMDGEIFGVLSFSSPNAHRREFTAHEIELVELMAKGIGRSILEDRMQAARERADALEQDRSQILEMVAKDHPLGTVLSKISRMVERQSPALAACILVARDGKLHAEAAPSMPETYLRRMQNIAIPSQDGCCFTAAFTRRTEIIESPPASRCAASEAGACVPEYCWQACGASPILSGSGELLGLLMVYWRLAIRPWTVERELLEMASHLAAIAIEHRALTDRLAFQAQHDALTGLANRNMLARTLDEHLHTMPRTAVAFIDLDRFKKINDHMGHTAGDQVLRSVASRLSSGLRGNEMVARFGGDEFVLVLHDFAGEDEAYLRVSAMLNELRKPIPFGDRTIWITASVGLSFHPHAGANAEALLGSADMTMYRVKNSGRNDVQSFAPGLDDQHLTKLELEHSLRQALERDEFLPLFQPIFDIRGTRNSAAEHDAELAGFEVLLEWAHPTMGRISPAQFIPIAEESGMIGPIGAWALRRACRQAASWRTAGLPAICISVNVSALQFARPDFVETVISALEEGGLTGEWLQLELTESALVQDAEDAAGKLRQLRALGVRIALDDFGTGYSSLGYLRSLPVDCIKIDQSFLGEVETSQAAATIIETIVTLAHNMGLTVVAEGVETERQLALLKKANCDMVQGHLLSRALDVNAARQRITQ